jgi:sugar/nucleoside kinase (ribokinase family)
VRVDFLCAGETLWDVHVPARGGPDALEWMPGGGAVNVARALKRAGARVALSGRVGDDLLGRALLAALKRERITPRLTRTAEPTGFVFVERGREARPRVVPHRAKNEQDVTFAADVQARVLVLSGLAPWSRWNQAARAARRTGGIVVTDLNARPFVWRSSTEGARLAVKLAKDCDVLKATRRDLETLGMTERDLLAARRRDATTILTDGPRPPRAIGPFGEVEGAVSRARRSAIGGGDAFVAAVALAVRDAGPDVRAGRDFWLETVGAASAAARAWLSRSSSR